MTGPAGDVLGAAARLEGVPSALAAARDGVDALLRDRGLRRTTPADTAEALLRGAVASARLAGSASTVADAREGRGDALTQAALRLNAGLLALVPVVTRSPLQAFARLHALAAAGLTPDASLGRPRADPSASAGLRRLADLLLAPTSAPGIAVAAFAHAEIATAAPFEVGSDLVARALERLLLAATGVDPASVTVPEAGHLRMGADYAHALSAAANRDTPGLHRWLLYSCTALARGVADSPLVEPSDSPGL